MNLKTSSIIYDAISSYAEGALGYHTHLVGGYVRDTIFGHTPKDMDLLIPCGESHSDSDMFEHAETLCQILSSVLRAEKLTSQVSIAQAYSTAQSDFNDRLHAVVQVNCEDGTKIDVLFSKAVRLSDALKAFDSNINQCFMGIQMYWLGTQKLPEEVRVLKEISQARAARLRVIADRLGLPVDEESFAKYTKPSPVTIYDDEIPF